MIDYATDLFWRYRWTVAWAAYVVYCIAIWQVYEATR